LAITTKIEVNVIGFRWETNDELLITNDELLMTNC
jgi:hypothetical protein